MAIKVACLKHHGSKRYRHIATAMYAGVRRHGDQAVMVEHDAPVCADVAVIYGWKLNRNARRYPQFIYADLGYWKRETHYRMTVGGWGPEGYVHAGLPADRLESFGVSVHPWREGSEVMVIGATEKSAREHGFAYMEWETQMVGRLKAMGHQVTYRPKPNDKMKRRIAGAGYDQGSLSSAFDRAKAVVAHHSNVCVEALAAGIPVHCAIGAAAAFSNPIDKLCERLEGREQFLADVGWLQWSLDEMRSGDYWAHVKDRGLVC